MPKPREPIPSPLDALRATIERGAVGQKRADPPAEAETTEGAEAGALASTSQQDTLPTSQQVDKPKKRERVSGAGWLQQAIFLPGELRKWLRLRAKIEEREIGEIVAEALQEYRARRGI